LLALALSFSAVGIVGAQDETAQPEGGRGGHVRELVQLIAEEAGLQPREVLRQLRNGATLADLITANGGDVQAVSDAVVASATARIEAAISNGRITRERADQMLANLPEHIERVINGELGIRDRLRDGVLHLVLDQTGLTPAELRQQLAGGATLAQVLTDNGVIVEAFVAEATEQLQTRLDAQVANGSITAERAAELLSEFETRLTEHLNSGQRWEVESLGV
jgi:hypothetical protein